MGAGGTAVYSGPMGTRGYSVGTWGQSVTVGTWGQEAVRGSSCLQSICYRPFKGSFPDLVLA